MHKCNPKLCTYDKPEQEIPNTYDDDYVATSDELKYAKATFAQYEVQFLFTIFILINCK